MNKTKQKLDKYSTKELEYVIQSLPKISKPITKLVRTTFKAGAMRSWFSENYRKEEISKIKDSHKYTVFVSVNHIREITRINNNLGKPGVNQYKARVDSVYAKSLKAKREAQPSL